MRHPDEGAAVLGAQATGDDHLAVFGKRLADRRQRFLDCRVDEAASIDDDEIGALVRWRDCITLRAQPGEDLLRVDECFRAAERDESDA